MAPVLALLTVSGKGRITVREQCYELNAGSLVLVPSAFPMEYGTDVTAAHPEWEFYWLNPEGSYVRRLARTLWEDGRGVHTCRQPAGFRTLFQSLMEESAVSHLQERRRSDRVQAICDRLLDECFFDTPPAADRRAGEILQYLQDRYQQDITLAQLGERFYLSVNHLIRIFRDYTGYSPYEYLKRYRLLKTCELLQSTDVSVGEIGRRVGYRNASHFAAQFHKLYGLSPHEYRKLFRGE